MNIFKWFVCWWHGRHIPIWVHTHFGVQRRCIRCNIRCDG